MRWSADGLMEPTNLLEAATLHRSALVTCQCGHFARFETHCLWWHFHQRGWDDRGQALRERFWCRVCASKYRRKIRPVRIAFVNWTKGDFELPWPDERAWKQATRRLR